LSAEAWPITRDFDFRLKPRAQYGGAIFAGGIEMTISSAHATDSARRG
jgi:hypothetical protein